METTIANSINAFKQIQDKIPSKRKRIYQIVESNVAISLQEICDRYNISSNSVSPRLLELRETGLIKVVGTRISKKSNMEMAMYSATTENERIEIVNKKYQELIDKKNKLINDLNLNLSTLTRDAVKRHIRKIEVNISRL